VNTECTLHAQHTLETELEKQNMLTFTKIKNYEKTSRNLKEEQTNEMHKLIFH